MTDNEVLFLLLSFFLIFSGMLVINLYKDYEADEDEKSFSRLLVNHSIFIGIVFPFFSSSAFLLLALYGGLLHFIVYVAKSIEFSIRSKLKEKNDKDLKKLKKVKKKEILYG